MKKISLIGILVFIIDRITKIIITNNFVLNIRNEIIKGFFYITNCHNEGAAFSIFSGNVIFLIIITFIVIYLIFTTLKRKSKLDDITIVSYGLLLGGIIGNLFDRLFYGYVIDFIDLIIFKYDFAIFNVADIAICIGAFMLLFYEGSDLRGRNKNNS